LDRKEVASQLLLSFSFILSIDYDNYYKE